MSEKPWSGESNRVSQFSVFSGREDAEKWLLK
jgi:hypothetical protein